MCGGVGEKKKERKGTERKGKKVVVIHQSVNNQFAFPAREDEKKKKEKEEEKEKEKEKKM